MLVFNELIIAEEINKASYWVVLAMPGEQPISIESIQDSTIEELFDQSIGSVRCSTSMISGSTLAFTTATTYSLHRRLQSPARYPGLKQIAIKSLAFDQANWSGWGNLQGLDALLSGSLVSLDYSSLALNTYIIWEYIEPCIIKGARPSINVYHVLEGWNETNSSWEPVGNSFNSNTGHTTAFADNTKAYSKYRQKAVRNGNMYYHGLPEIYVEDTAVHSTGMFEYPSDAITWGVAIDLAATYDPRNKESLKCIMFSAAGPNAGGEATFSENIPNKFVSDDPLTLMNFNFTHSEAV